MLAHVSIQCANFEESAAFYDAVLAPLGGGRVLEDEDNAIGYGCPPVATFWIGAQQTDEGFRETHIAFIASDRESVHGFFEAASARGAEILHEPKLWPEYDPAYYAAFVRDPDGNNIEAVCLNPSGRPEKPIR
jgi:catechol 2,3-dioxygenase-like lactoylglutathione lyase family enzyme